MLIYKVQITFVVTWMFCLYKKEVQGRAKFRTRFENSYISEFLSYINAK